jgi:hypothetical protein
MRYLLIAFTRQQQSKWCHSSLDGVKATTFDGQVMHVDEHQFTNVDIVAQLIGGNNQPYVNA